VRLFVAVTPSAPALAHLDQALAEVRSDAPDLRWTPAERWHLTLTFCGEVDDHTARRLSGRLARAASRAAPMRLTLAGAGGFSRAARATVLWVGLDGDTDVMRRLAAATSAAARRAGIEVESRSWRPHLTVARSSRPSDLRELVSRIATYRGPGSEIETLQLVRSVTTAGRPAYTDIDRWRLGQR
jgi:2'-5' RNA ligase